MTREIFKTNAFLIFDSYPIAAARFISLFNCSLHKAVQFGYEVSPIALILIWQTHFNPRDKANLTIRLLWVNNA